MSSTESFATLSEVTAPIERARGLPNAHYTHPDTIAAENRACLQTTWTAIGVGADVAAPGDAMPLDFLGQPLLMLRDDAGAVRVFYNICRHRGMILVDAPRRIEGAIRCPYHSWCYARDGRLVATPHVGGPGQNAHPGIDRRTLGLVEVRSHVWRDVVFVNLSGDAAPFEEVHAGLIARWAEFDRPLHHGGPESRFTLDVGTNWKLAVENYCESYHLPWVHPGLNSYSRLEDHYPIEAPGGYSGQGTLVYRQTRGPGEATFPDFEGLSGKWDEGAEYVALYPNVLLGVHRDHAFAIVLEPVSHDRTREHVHLYYASPDTDPTLRALNAAQWKGVFVEDVFVVEGMQRGRFAAGFDGGRFSPAMDGPTHCFHAWVAGRMQALARAAP
ncbi:aromatic ring-hydroxylating dioxygenase subunit alpha [Roseibacterium sp. SDUM158017]|uniref:aromatic ring-hydroxylating oxygenase subunit alpha n=1 Tax=Roseicyclus salinarum TaxID=3036773 RepID=UPI002414FA63|nr:aromatic ring-hydroxylating dioxygenase subunit alpha [Roseibacterium sp. SDUM158017]MDG4647565.1 aromatic ring-hydroxylating dioxygenase subunit alpha [Roseibacterium sp. SDUM158017]